ncbi:hypothetical protein B0T13DRAFT_151082 [Neurospora crassa]|nr:hypothetical protein B0T13DRAFT_151082 [Neurospora crassa]
MHRTVHDVGMYFLVLSCLVSTNLVQTYPDPQFPSNHPRNVHSVHSPSQLCQVSLSLFAVQNFSRHATFRSQCLLRVALR